MAKLFLTAFRNMAVDDFGRTIAAPDVPPLAEAFIEISHENNVSDPFPKYTAFICIKAEADCAMAFAAVGQDDPVADPNFHFVEGGERLFYGVKEGYRVACIEVSPELNVGASDHDDGRTEQQKPT